MRGGWRLDDGKIAGIDGGMRGEAEEGIRTGWTGIRILVHRRGALVERVAGRKGRR